MTKEEAIEVLEKMKYPYKGNKYRMMISNVVRDNEAIEMAVQALSQDPHEWLEMLVMCDNCGHAIHVKNEDTKEVQKEQVDEKWFIKGGTINLSDTVRSENLCDYCKHFERCEHDEREFWKANEQEPCDDCISRQAVMKMISSYFSAEESTTASLWYQNIKQLPSVRPQEPKTGYCKDCKWWKDSDGAFRRGVRAESQCPINKKEVFDGNGYCYLFEPRESEEQTDEISDRNLKMWEEVFKAEREG